MSVTPSLEQLAELVRQAEAKTRARKVEGEARQAAEQFREAEQKARSAFERARAAKSAGARALEQADADDQALKELVRKLAVYKTSLASGANAEQLVDASHAEIEEARRRARDEIEESTRALEEARRELRTATDHYRALRKEIDRLQPELAAQFAAEDRLLWDAESHYPGGQLHLLAHELESAMSTYGGLGKHEQYARLKVWIGRFRHHQAAHERGPDMTPELQALASRSFQQLKHLSKQYEPGYIEAFRQDFSTDWAAYVAAAEEQLALALENARRGQADAASSSASVAAAPASQPRGAQGAPNHHASSTTNYVNHNAGPYGNQPQPVGGVGRGAPLADLRELVARARLPEEGLDEFLVVLRRTVAEVGTTHPELLRLALPFREHIEGEGNDGLAALRRNLERIQARRDELTARGASADDRA